MEQERPDEVWVLADDRAGNVAQGLGVAEALGLPFAVKRIAYNRLGRLPNLILGDSLIALDRASRAALVPPWPRLVIAAGRRTAPVARWVKHRCGAFCTQIMDPGAGRSEFDLVVVPNHDGPLPDAANLLRVPGAPHRVTPQRLAAAAEAWRERLAHLPRPWIAVIVGGSTRIRPFTAEHARELARKAATMAAEAGGSLLLTTSRRTGAEAEAILRAELPEPRHTYSWADGGDNPYFAFLALADAVVVTGDSVSMVCEACATTAPVHIFAPPGMVADKHARLHAELYRLGLARPLSGAFASWTHPPLNAAAEIAAEIRQRLRPAAAEPEEPEKEPVRPA